MPRPNRPLQPRPDLGDDEARVLYHIRSGVSQGPGELVAQTGLSAGAVDAALVNLENRGYVSRRADGSFGAGGAG